MNLKLFVLSFSKWTGLISSKLCFILCGCQASKHMNIDSTAEDFICFWNGVCSAEEVMRWYMYVPSASSRFVKYDVVDG